MSHSTATRSRVAQRRMALLGIATILSLFLSLFPQVAGLPAPAASAHNLNASVVHVYFDPDTQAHLDNLIADDIAGFDKAPMKGQAQVAIVSVGSPVPSVSLTVPSESFIGQSFSFTAAFDNTSATDAGYGPFIDLIFPVTGADGNDGIDFSAATYLGLPVTATQLTFPGPGPTGCVAHPYAVDTAGTPLQVCGNTGDKLVVLQLPFGSFTAPQPPAAITINATMSNLADYNTPLTVRARAGFQYGSDALNNPSTDPSIVSQTSTSSSTWTPSAPVNPTVISLTKTYIGPEDETATGPNYPRQYRITATIAPSQTVTNLDVTDVLPTNLQFVRVDSTTMNGNPVSTTSVITPSTTTPGGTLTRRFATATNTAEMVFTYYVPLDDAASNPVINASNGDDATSVDDAKLRGSWTPLDTRDPVADPIISDVTANDHTLTDKSIAIQKSVAVVTDVGASGPTPGDTLEYTLVFQVSDYFAFTGVVITDTISDGQHVDTGFTPTLQVNGNTFTLAVAAINAANYSIVPNYTPADPAPNDGTTALHFRVSDEMISRGRPDGSLIGGCVPTTGAAAPNCDTYNDGPTTATVVFRTVILQNFTDTYPSGDASVDEGDKLRNDVTVDGRLLDTGTLLPTGFSEADTSAAGISIARGVLAKSIYAITDTAGNTTTTIPSPAQLAPGYKITYRLRWDTRMSAFEQFSLTDYLPLPVLWASEITAFTPGAAVPPPAGTATYGPLDTFHLLNGAPTPALTVDTVANSVKFTYGTFDDYAQNPTGVPSIIDILFTVTVSSDPFADGLFLTNQVRSFEASTNAGNDTQDRIVQFRLTEPVLAIRKGVLATSNAAGVFAPSGKLPANISVSAPGTLGCPRLSGTGMPVSSTNLGTTFDSNLSKVDAGDLVTFAIVVENKGSGLTGAFDVKLRDTLPAGLVVPPGGLNLCATDGTGAVISTTDIGAGLLDPAGGIELTDPGPTATPAGAIDPYSATSGRNIGIITFDLQVAGTAAPAQVLTNSATLFNYAGIGGGLDHTTTDLVDTASVTVASPTVSKSVTGTNQAHTTGSYVAIGEIITYTVAITVPEGTSPNVILTDILDAGLAYVNCASIVPSAGLSSSSGFGAACTSPGPTVGPQPPGDANAVNQGRRVIYSFGTVTNTDTNNGVAETVTITYRAVVLNSSGNTRSKTLKNTATWAWTGGTAVASAPNVTVVEPTLQVSKTANPTTGDAGDIITFTLVVSHAGASNAGAFEVSMSDLVPAGMTYVAGSLSPSGGLAPTTFSDAGAPTLTATWVSFPQGSPSTLTFRATLDTSVSPGQAIVNTANVKWTSLPGDMTTAQSTYNTLSTERTGNTGDPGGAANTYSASGPATVTVFSPNPTKSIVATSESFTGVVAGTERVAIGEIVRYRLVARVPEGTATNLQLRDGLPLGLRFLNDNTAKVAFVANGPGITSSTLSGSGLSVTGNETTVASITPTFLLPDNAVSDNATTNSDVYASGTAPYFKLGNVINSDSDLDQEFVVIEFNAIVENIAGNQAFNNATGATSATNRDNNFQFLVGGTSIATSANVRVTIAEPVINLTKTVTTAPVDAGDTVVYQLTYSNVASGNDRTLAFDVVLTDTLSSNLDLQSVAVTVPAGSTATDSSTLGVGGVVRVSVDKLPPTADIPTTPKGVTIVVTARVVSAAANGLTIPNTANLTYTSLPGANGTTGNPTGSNNTGTPGSDTGERTGGGGINDYTGTSTVNSVLATPTIAKLAPSPAQYTIGDSITYTIRVALPEGATPNLRVTDALPAGLGYVSHSVITTAAASGGLLSADYNGTLNTSPSCTGCTAGASGTLTFTFGNTQTNGSGPINGTSGNQFLVRVVARVLNVSTPLNQAGTTLQNTASLIYDDPTLGNNRSVSGGSQTVTVIEPSITAAKAVTPAANVQAGTILNYTVTFTNTGNSPAYDVTAQDTLAQGVAFTALVGCTLQPDNTAVSSTATSAGNTVTFEGSPAGSWDIPVGKAIRCGYTATAQSSLYVNGGHTNTVDADWSSQDGAVANERVYDDTLGYTADGTQDTATATFTVAAPAFAKTDGGTTQAEIGAVIRYTLTITSPLGTLRGLTVRDVLPAGLIYNGDAVVSGIATAPTFNASTPNDGSAAVTLTWSFGDAVVTASPAQITFTATVANVASNQAGVVLTNTATLDHSNAAGVIQASLNSTDDVRIVKPAIGVAKELKSATNNGDGSFTVAYSILVKNYGDVVLHNLQVTDTLAATFGAPATFTVLALTSPEFTEKAVGAAGYTGTAPNDKLLMGTDTLGVGASGTISLTVVVTPNVASATYNNQAIAGGTSPAGTPVSDASQNGADPDPGSPPDGDPTNNNDPTPVTLTENPVLGVAKQVAGTPHNNGDGTFTVVYGILVRNYGNVRINNLQVTDNLDLTFGAGKYAVTNLTSAQFAENWPAGYNGSTNTNLLLGTDTLAVGGSGTITLTVRVTPGNYPGPYLNQAIGSGASPVGTPVSDLSQDGPNPDPDGNGPGDNSEKTPVSFNENPKIGLAKAVKSNTHNGDGTFTVAYTLTVKNYGDVEIRHLQVQDNLDATFGAGKYAVNNLTSAAFAVNWPAGYNGSTNINLLKATDTLAVNGTGTLVLTVTVTPGVSSATYWNVATVVGSSPGGSAVTDQSQNGTDPDPGNPPDGDPTNNNDPTPVSYAENPKIGLAKRVVGAPVNNGNGTHDVTYEIRVQNIGDVTLRQVQVTDNLAATFAPTATFTAISVTSAKFTVNAVPPGGSYTGNPPAPGINLLAGTDSLPVGDQGTITLVVRVNPDGFVGPYNNSAIAAGVSPGQAPVSDISTDGDDPDPSTPGNMPADNPGAGQYSDPTPVSFDIAAIGDKVWWDINGDGQQQTGEPGIPGVKVNLLNAGGGVITSTVTDGLGLYKFANLSAGAYTVQIDPAEFAAGGTLYQWGASPQYVGPPATDSNGDPATHAAGVTVAGGASDMTVDFGFTVASSYTIAKQLNTPEPVRSGAEISFTIRITNTGNTWIAFLPLRDTYNTTFLTYGFGSRFAEPQSESTASTGMIDWSDLTQVAPKGFGVDLAPGKSFTVTVYFTAREDTSELPNRRTINTATVHDAYVDPDGNGPIPASSLSVLPEQSASAGVQIQRATGIGVTDFRGVRSGDQVVLTWRTANEASIAGFYVSRRSAGGEWVRLSDGLTGDELIFAEHAGASQGAEYLFTDENAPSGPLAYLLEVVGLDGQIRQGGVVESY